MLTKVLTNNSKFFPLYIISLTTFIYVLLEMLNLSNSNFSLNNSYFIFDIILIFIGYLVYEIFDKNVFYKKLVINYFFNIF